METQNNHSNNHSFTHSALKDRELKTPRVPGRELSSVGEVLRMVSLQVLSILISPSLSLKPPFLFFVTDQNLSIQKRNR